MSRLDCRGEVWWINVSLLFFCTTKTIQSNMIKNGLYMYLPSRMWHKVNFFKQSLTGLNPEFAFSLTASHTKVKESSLLYYLPITGGRKFRFIPFPRLLTLWKCKQPHPGFELRSLCPFPTMITITPQTPLDIDHRLQPSVPYSGWTETIKYFLKQKVY